MSALEPINQRLARLREGLEPADRLARHRTGRGRGAAVLMPIFELDGDLHLVYIRRSDHVESHRGQVAFPGGRVDPTDETLLHTALREAQAASHGIARGPGRGRDRPRERRRAGRL